MQAKIDFGLPSGVETIVVELIDNPGVTAWAKHVKQLPSARVVTLQAVAGQGSFPILKSSGMWAQQQLAQQSLAISRLPLPLPVTEPEEITQHHLNVWHRWFTDNTKTIGVGNNDYAVEFHWLHEINQVVHQLEHSICEWPANELGVVGYDLNIQPEVDDHGFGAGYINVDRSYHSWEYADLILDQAVHGKTTMQSFVDNDNPLHWDTTGHHISWGGCKLVKTDYRPKVYQGDIFRRWLERNNATLNDLWGDYPLGNIVNRNQEQLDYIFSFNPNKYRSVNIFILD